MTTVNGSKQPEDQLESGVCKVCSKEVGGWQAGRLDVLTLRAANIIVAPVGNSI